MKIEGKIEKSGKWWAVSVPLLLIFSQGKTKKSALLMIKSAVEELIDVNGFKVHCGPVQANTFSISSNNRTLLMAFILKQQRLKNKKSIKQVTGKLGWVSATSYSRYEQTGSGLTMDKFLQVLSVIDDDTEPVLTLPAKVI